LNAENYTDMATTKKPDKKETTKKATAKAKVPAKNDAKKSTAAKKAVGKKPDSDSKKSKKESLIRERIKAMIVDPGDVRDDLIIVPHYELKDDEAAENTVAEPVTEGSESNEDGTSVERPYIPQMPDTPVITVPPVIPDAPETTKIKVEKKVKKKKDDNQLLISFD